MGQALTAPRYRALNRSLGLFWLTFEVVNKSQDGRFFSHYQDRHTYKQRIPGKIARSNNNAPMKYFRTYLFYA